MVLQNKVALITGAGRGLGEAIALAYARAGAATVLAARTLSEIEAVAAKIHELGGRAVAIAADVAVEPQVTALVAAALKDFRRIDVLVNCAGIYGPIGPLWKADSSQWIEAVNINLVGPFLCCKAVLPYMIERRAGKIVSLAGGGAAMPLPRFSAYAVSKAALVRMTENLAEEVREFNIQVNAIAPGLIDTRLQDQVLAAGEAAGELLDRIRQLRATGQGGVSPEVAAALAVFLASPASDQLTGRFISAPHDGWQNWDGQRIAQVMAQPWFTLRRLDPFTLKPLHGKEI